MQYVDTNEVTRLGQEIKGQTEVTRFVRLISDLPPQPDSVISWSITGSTDIHRQRFLDLHVQGDVTLDCQRCMGTMVLPIDARSRVQVVQTQEALDVVSDQEPDELDDAPDCIMGSPRLDVLELVEDELILSLPYVSKHEVCPSPVGQQEETYIDTSRPSPFAVLSQLKKD